MSVRAPTVLVEVVFLYRKICRTDILRALKALTMPHIFEMDHILKASDLVRGEYLKLYVKILSRGCSGFIC